MSNENMYAYAYSEENLWEKLNSSAEAAGINVVQKALTLYFTLQRARTRGTARGIILGALGYFIMPFDAVPDMLALPGYVDDLGVLVWAYTGVREHITDRTIEKAEQKSLTWFRKGSSEPK